MCRKNSAVEVELAMRLDAGRLRDAVTLGLETYGEPLWRSIQFVVRDEDETEDAYGAFLEQLWRSIEGRQWQRRCSFATWARQLAFRAALDQVRRQKAQRNVTLSSGKHPVVDGTTWRKEPDVLPALERLSPYERALIRARLWERLSWKQIATLLWQGEAMTEEQIAREAGRHRVNYYRATAKLRERMQCGSEAR